ncbi:MAG: Ldh family oxidoreductase [Betaproteobacteria bacterium]
MNDSPAYARGAGPFQSPSTLNDRLRFDAGELLVFARTLLEAAALAPDIAATVAQTLLEGDLLGHDTHGLQLLGGYLRELDAGSMKRAGTPRVIAERSVVATWDGERLPGPWLVHEAIQWATPRAKLHGQASVVIRRSHHIACLAAYLEHPARDGLVVLVSSSDPAVASVAPFGGTTAVFTPNPIAAGFPTGGDPVMIDISASVTTNGMTARLRDGGERGRHAWWLDDKGCPTNDPSVLFGTPPGTILPLGGVDSGHKGYGLALLVEALTGGLAGHGRADPAEGWGATVHVQLFDPDAFAGLEACRRQTEHIARACRQSPAPAGGQPVRLPGERGLARKREQLERGVALHPAILPALAARAAQARIVAPAPR